MLLVAARYGPCEIGHLRITSSAAAARYGPCEIGDLQDRMKRAVALLGPEEVKNIVREEGKIEVMLQGLDPNSSAFALLPCPYSAEL